MEEYFSAERLMDLDIGSVVQVNNEEKDQHFVMQLVGVDQGHSVICTLPAPHNLPDGSNYNELFPPGLVFEMRIIHDGRVIAFESSIRLVLSEPIKLLVGSYPEMIESRKLRKDTRFPCTLSCDIRSGDYESYGVITNISNGGCQLNLPADVDYLFLEEAMDVQDSIDLEIFFPFAESSITINAHVRSVNSQNDKTCFVGLAFSYDYESIRKYLDSLQLESIAPFFD